MSIANDSDYCHKCKVKIMGGTCFCDWPEDIENKKPEDSPDEVWFPQATPAYRANLKEEREQAEAFKTKLKSISFTRVKGGSRG